MPVNGQLMPRPPVVAGALSPDRQEVIKMWKTKMTCDKSLQIFLKEKGKLSLKEMTKVSNDYLEAHGYPAENHERKINGVSNNAYTHTQCAHALVFEINQSFKFSQVVWVQC